MVVRLNKVRGRSGGWRRSAGDRVTATVGRLGMAGKINTAKIDRIDKCGTS